MKDGEEHVWDKVVLNVQTQFPNAIKTKICNLFIHLNLY